MAEAGYKRYLKEGGKVEIRRWTVPIRNPLGAHRKLEELLSKRWQWLLLPNNCVSFVERLCLLVAPMLTCITTAQRWKPSNENHPHLPCRRVSDGCACVHRHAYVRNGRIRRDCREHHRTFIHRCGGRYGISPATSEPSPVSSAPNHEADSPRCWDRLESPQAPLHTALDCLRNAAGASLPKSVSA